MLTDQERQIVEYGKSQGKSRDEVLQALTKYRTQNTVNSSTPASSTPAQPGILDRIKTKFNERVDTAANAQVSDQNIASKVLQTVGAGAGFVGDVAMEGIKAVTPDPIEKVVSSGLESVLGPVVQTRAAQGLVEWAKAHPEAAKNLESVMNIVGITPVGKGAEIVGKTGFSVAGKSVDAAAQGTTVAGRLTKGAGAALNEAAFTPNVATAERILKYEADVPFLKRVSNVVSGTPAPNRPTTLGTTAMEKGLMGTERMIGVQAKRQADQLWKQKIAPAVKNSPVVITKDELFAPALEVINRTTDPTRKRALQNAFDALMEDYAGVDVWNLETAQALKRDFDTFTPAKKFRGQEVASEVRTLQHAMADGIRQRTYKELSDVNIRKDYLDWANLSALEDIGVKAISESRLKGGFGGFWSAMWDMTTTPVKTIGGQTLYRVGNVLEFTGAKGIRRFSEYLKKQGFSAPSSSQRQR